MRLFQDIKSYRSLAHSGGWATLFDISFIYLILFRIGSAIYQSNRILFSPVRVFEKILEIVFGIYIPFGCKIDGGLIIFHCNGVIINGKSEIGRNCRIYARVCIGNRFPGDGTPIIGNNVTLGTGACVFGPVQIPDGVSIPANSVVTPRSIDQILHKSSEG